MVGDIYKAVYEVNGVGHTGTRHLGITDYS